MKRLLRNLFLLLICIGLHQSSFAQGDLILVGLLDGPFGGAPKFAELYVANDIPDLSIYGLGSANNGNGTDSVEWAFPAEAATAGSTIYVVNDAAEFSNFMGFNATYEDGGAACSFNGDDTFEVFKDGAVIDVFGFIDVDGSDSTWEYLDGWVKRKNGTGPDGTTFVESNWEYSGINVFDDQTSNATSPKPYPTDTYNPEDGGGDKTVDLILKGIIYANADVKVTEYEVLADIPDLSIYGVGCANNGGGSDGQEWAFPAEPATKGDRIYVARDGAAFRNFFGFDANYTDPDGNAHNFNGDDGLEIFMNGESVEIFGDLILDGTGEAWEYVNTWAHRKDGTAPTSPAFVLEDWEIAPMENYTGVATNAEASMPYPAPEGDGGTEDPTDLVITEIMYNSPGTDLEFLEIYNNTDAAIDLTGYAISDGIDFTFPEFTLEAGAIVLVSDDAAGMLDFYGVEAFEWSSGALSNGGETVIFVNINGDILDSVNYDDAEPWTPTADGLGASLILCDISADNNDGANWQRSTISSGKIFEGREVFASPGVIEMCVDVPILGIQRAEAIVGEADADGILDILFYLDNPNEMETSFDVRLVEGGTADENDFTFTPITITFPPMTSGEMMITVNIIDDNEQEPEESFSIEMVNPSNGALITNSTMEVRIIDNDAPVTNALKIIGLIHGPLSGVPKAVQFLAVKDIPNLALFGLGCANNGGGTDGQEYTFPSQSMDAGTCFYLTNDADGFRDFFGFDADFVDGGSANNFNGDDAYEVFESGEVIDVFGEIDADGTGTAWEYSLSWAHRIDANSGPDGSTFVLENWEFGGVDTLANAATNAEASNPYPDDMCGVVNIEKVDLSSFIQLYPNPAKSILQITSSIQLDEIEVFDVMGKSVLEVNQPANYTSLEVGDLPNNLYFIRFISDNQMWTEKVMIHR